MINRLRLVRNIGVFDSVDSAATIPLARLTLMYAENGRGKTTLAAVLRSLATGDPVPIMERRRLSAANPPHVVLDCDGGPPAAMFQDGAWNRSVPQIAVFDDVFIDENVCSGLAVEPEHRQHLHELILGAQGVALNRQLQGLVDRIEAHNAELRTKAAAIPAAERGTLSVDQFCGLPARDDIESAIQAAERRLAAAREQEPIRTTQAFDAFSLPSFDVAAIDRALTADLPSLDAAAAARVQAHLNELGSGGEGWVAEGMRRVGPQGTGSTAGTCPFCAQGLAASPVISHYRAYFSDAYADLKRAVSETLETINRAHGGDVPAAFERWVRVTAERARFWAGFCDVPDVTLDTAAIARDWRAAHEAAATALTAKRATPLERLALGQEALAAIRSFDAHRETVAALNQELQQQANPAIRLVKEQAATGNPTALAADLARLRAVKVRHIAPTAALCQAYLDEQRAKANTERLRDDARRQLDRHRAAVFPAHQTAINVYLERFNAGFRLDRVTAANTRAGSTCTYNVVVNDTPVPVAVATPGQPSFRSTLSAGDRNTLALAFFFASLDQDSTLATKTVVIDDPISSLDEHRALTTVQEVRRLAERVSQVIVLSHSKPFLCGIWENAGATARCAVEVRRAGQDSEIREWDVRHECITEHDRRHALLREYLATGGPGSREVAEAIRPVLEAFVRVAYPEHFPPGTLLGPFLGLCAARVGTPQQILNPVDLVELRDLVEYANRFHHDTNRAWETETINDGALTGWVRRALGFATRAPAHAAIL
jgi:wobble nucleotide-excising tRNase